MTVQFDLVNLVMSETGVLKKFRLNYFLKKTLIVLKSQSTFVLDVAITNGTAKKEWIHVNVNRVVVTLFKWSGGGLS